MSSFSIDGLATGLDTTSIIEQLVQIERQPIVRLEERRNGFDARIAAWNAIEAQFANVQTAIDRLTDSGVSAATVTTNPSTVTSTVTGTASPGSHSFTVDQVATAHRLLGPSFASASTASGTGSLVIGRGLADLNISGIDASALTTGAYELSVDSVGLLSAEVTFDGVTQTVDKSGTITLTAADGSTVEVTISGSLAAGSASFASAAAGATTTVGQLAAALDGLGGYASTTVIDRQDGSAEPGVLVVTALDTGADNALEVFRSGLASMSGTFTETRAAQDTVLDLGGGLTVRRAGTVIDGVVPGVSLDVGSVAAGTDVAVTVSRDSATVANNVKSYVDALNRLLSLVGSAGASDPEAGRVGPLSGDSTLRRLEAALRAPLGSPAESGTFRIAAQLGISSTSNGSYTFDRDAFLQAYASDPVGARTFLTGSDGESGLLGGLAAAMESLSSTGGLIATARSSAEASIEEIDDTIASRERRLEQYEARIRAQFTAMETLIAQLSNQSSFLGGLLGA